MRLKQFDGQCVSITDANGDVFDGYCSYNSDEYNEHEFGRREEGLEIVNFLFYRSDIKTIESLEVHKGPYGKFLDPFGTLEEKNVQDGFDSILNVLFCGNTDHVLRMLRCLDYYYDPENNRDFPCRYETYGALMELEDSTNDETVKAETNRILDRWKPPQSSDKAE